MKKSKKRIWVLRILLSILAVLAVITAIAWKDIKEIAAIFKYAGLFEPEHMAENFRSMHKLYPYKTVHKSNDIFVLEYEPRPIDIAYTFNEKTYSLDEWIKLTDTTGLLILHSDKIIYEKYFQNYNENTHLISMSVSKSIISFLIGAATEEGSIKSLSEPVNLYEPELSKSGYNNVSIKDVLQMSSGIRFTEDYQDLKSDFVRLIAAFTTGSLNDFICSLPNERQPGTYNKYISANTQVLGMVLATATGKSVTQYTEEKLWSKIGTESDAYWITDPNGTELTLGGFCPILRDLARFGLLYLNDGKNYKNEQLISKEWIHASVTPDSPHLMPGRDNPQAFEPYGYGYHWWLPEFPMGDYVAIGIYGQFIYIHPPSKTVIVKTSAYKEYDGTVFDFEDMNIGMFQLIASSLK